jgi:hypothetical protein
LTGSCSAFNCTATADNEFTGAAETLTFAGTAGAPVWIVVDGYTAAEVGAFRLKVE